MTAIESIKSVLGNKYKSEDGDDFQIELLEGLTDAEIKEFKNALPKNNLPEEIEELLRFARGFGFLFLEEARFDRFDDLGVEELFPFSVTLVGDGAGNFWVQDISSEGEWKEIYYVCHDPPVIVKHSNNLAEFIMHIDEYGRLDRASHFYEIYDKVVGDIWIEEQSIMDKNNRKYNFPKAFLAQLPEVFMIADLVNEPIGTGFNWAKYGVNNKIIRFDDEPIWIMEKKKDKASFFTKLFTQGI